MSESEQLVRFKPSSFLDRDNQPIPCAQRAEDLSQIIPPGTVVSDSFGCMGVLSRRAGSLLMYFRSTASAQIDF